MKQIKLVMGMLFFLFLVGIVNAAVLINEFTVDPQQDWDNSGSITTTDEWFELYNDGSSAVDLTDWRLELIDSTNETELLQGTINANSYFLIENPTGQQNNDGKLKLYDSNNNLIDSVAYGSYGSIEDGNADTVDNECLALTNNNFAKQKCTKGYSNNMKIGNSLSLTINAVVEGSAPTIYNIVIEPDEGVEDGVQITPSPGLDKTVSITAYIDGNVNQATAEILKDGILVYEIVLSVDSNGYYGEFLMSFYDEPGNYTVRVSATNNEGTTIVLEYFEYLGLIGIELDASSLTFSSLVPGITSYILGDSDMATLSKPTIKNIGNVVIDTEISGTDLTNENATILVDNIQYRFGTLNYKELLFNPVINEINLGIGSSINLDLRLFVPASTISGTYSGSVLITALS